jgi:hypothetical protein
MIDTISSTKACSITGSFKEDFTLQWRRQAKGGTHGTCPPPSFHPYIIFSATSNFWCIPEAFAFPKFFFKRSSCILRNCSLKRRRNFKFKFVPPEMKFTRRHRFGTIKGDKKNPSLNQPIQGWTFHWAIWNFRDMKTIFCTLTTSQQCTICERHDRCKSSDNWLSQNHKVTN